ncbi:688_t:CDS:2 [Ambispora leptoticha]|uniref:688_t:CDS:1 n=1 Tax=Ambispora leptoticha TaxID=144679 RepID=A0A9N8VR54_9GLOM|nr:688_t:CDS:2 [Ambispora leptoticha]
MFGKNKISLEIKIDENFTGLMYGTPDESSGCQLQGRIILKSDKIITANQLSLIFTGKVCVSCGPQNSSRPEYSEEQILYHKISHFLSSEHTKKRIPPGTHEFYFEFDLPGDLPTSFKGTRGKIEYYCHALLNRPTFCSDVSSERCIITLKRSLLRIDHIMRNARTIMEDESNFNINRNSINVARSFSEGMLDNNNVQYQISTPIMAYCEGGLVSIELYLKSMNPNIIIESVEYGLKEYTSFHTTGEASLISVIASVYEETFPLGKKKINIDPFSENSNTIPINFRLFPRVKCDVDTRLIELFHKLLFTITIKERRKRQFSLLRRQLSQLADTEECSSLEDSAHIVRHPISADEHRHYQYINSLEALEGRRRTVASQPHDINRNNSRRSFSLRPSKLAETLLNENPPSYGFATMIPPPPDYATTSS